MHHVLKILISQHPALSIIGISRPSSKKHGNHRLWEAHLPIINLEDCVEFLEKEWYDDVEMGRIIEDIHNTWFDTNDKTKPCWRVIVLNGKTVVFVAHHSIADGMGGYAFHRTFLQALNSSPSTSPDVDENEEQNQRIQTPRIDPSSLPTPIDDLREKMSWFHAIKDFLFWTLLRFFVPAKYLYFSDAVISPHLPTVKHPLPHSPKTVTRASILRINKDMMKKCLSACREHETTFTALLHTIVQVTLAVDEYPGAKLGFSRQAVSVRRLLKREKWIGKDVITNATSVYYHIDFLSKYRKVLLHSPLPPTTTGNSELVDQEDERGTLNKDLIWKLSKKYKQDLNKAIHTTKSVAQNILVTKALGEDDEDMGEFYGMGLYQSNSFLISNLGVFEPRADSPNNVDRADSEMGGKWQVNDVAFSAGAIRAKLGVFGIVFNVASVKDGDCVICGCWEEGVLREDMVKRVMRRVGERIAMVG